MFRNILVPLDGTPAAEAVLPLVRTLVRRAGASVALLHVIEEPGWRFGGATTSEDAVLRYLQMVEQGLASSEAKVTVAMVRGGAAEEILRAARAGRYDMVAMGAGDERSTGGYYFGNVAWQVLHRSTTPMLVAHEPLDRTVGTEDGLIQRVIVPLDGSQTAEAVLPHAGNLAEMLHADLYLLQVVPPPLTFTSPGTGSLVSSFKDGLFREAEAYLERVARHLGPRPSRVTPVVLSGPVAPQIVDFARRLQNSLVAMASHGRTGVRGLLLGSVAAQVVQHSGDPVLLIRPDTTPPLA